MDTSKKYILMCEKAVEIQRMRDKEPFQFEEDKYGIHYVGEDVYFCGLKNPHNKKSYQCVWLPYQHQLQEILGYKKLVTLFQAFNGWAYSVNCFDWSWCDSTDKLWLAFVMKEKYRKIFNGKDWVKR